MTKKLAGVCGLVLVGAVLAAQETAVSISTADKFELGGKVYSKSGRPGPGVLAIHDCNSDQSGYATLADMLSTVGYHVLTFDMRGAGASKRGEFANGIPQSKALANLAGDLDAAFRSISSHPQANATRIGIIASGCAVGPAVDLAQRNRGAIKGLVLLSGSLNSAHEAFLKESTLPVLAIASQGDPAAEGLKRLASVSENRDTKLQLLTNAGQGVAMFQKDPGLEADIALWLRSTVQVQSYSLRDIGK